MIAPKSRRGVAIIDRGPDFVNSLLDCDRVGYDADGHRTLRSACVTQEMSGLSRGPRRDASYHIVHKGRSDER